VCSGSERDTERGITCTFLYTDDVPLNVYIIVDTFHYNICEDASNYTMAITFCINKCCKNCQKLKL
jgi:hypothetical protein